MNIRKWTGTALVFCLVAGLARAAELVPGKFYTDGRPSRKTIALSFDDGPGPNTRKVLDLLDRYKIKATFFMNGDQVRIRPQVAREVMSRGQEIGDHTWSHLNFYAYQKKNGVEMTKEKVRDEIKKSRDIIAKTTGKAPAICRMPNGYNRPWLGAIAKEYGYSLVNWTFGEDWTKIPVDQMTKDYVRHVRPGTILLFHDGGAHREKTLQVLPAVIEEARKRGLDFVTVSEILSE